MLLFSHFTLDGWVHLLSLKANFWKKDFVAWKLVLNYFVWIRQWSIIYLIAANHYLLGLCLAGNWEARQKCQLVSSWFVREQVLTVSFCGALNFGNWLINLDIFPNRKFTYITMLTFISILERLSVLVCFTALQWFQD